MPRRPVRPPAEEHRSPELAHGGQKLPAPTPAAASDLSDPERAPPEEPGVSVEAMEVGEQFLRDATEQYNFESELGPEADPGALGVPVGQMISDATLESANQDDDVLPISHSLADDQPEVLAEPEQLEVDLTRDAIVAASLFDQPVSNLEEEEEDEDDFAAAVAPPFREPAVVTDDPSEVDESRREEIQALLDERVKKRLHVDRLPKDSDAKRNT